MKGVRYISVTYFAAVKELLLPSLYCYSYYCSCCCQCCSYSLMLSLLSAFLSSHLFANTFFCQLFNLSTLRAVTTTLFTPSWHTQQRSSPPLAHLPTHPILYSSSSLQNMWLILLLFLVLTYITVPSLTPFFLYIQAILLCILLFFFPSSPLHVESLSSSFVPYIQSLLLHIRLPSLVCVIIKK